MGKMLDGTGESDYLWENGRIGRRDLYTIEENTEHIGEMENNRENGQTYKRNGKQCNKMENI